MGPMTHLHSRPASGHGAQVGNYRSRREQRLYQARDGHNHSRHIPLRPRISLRLGNSNGAWRMQFNGRSRLPYPPSRDHDRRRRLMRLLTTLQPLPPERQRRHPFQLRRPFRP